MKASRKKLVPICSVLLALLLLGSRFYSGEHEDNKSYKNKRVLLRVPVGTFGKTHFILGLSAHDVVAEKSKQRRTSQAYPAVNEVYFAPDDDIQQKLIDLIDQEKEAIHLAIYTFTDKNIAQALCDAHARGVAVEVVVDPCFLHDRFTKISMLHEAGIPIYIYDPQRSKAGRATYSNLMHNKFVLFTKNIDDQPLVWTGSFNFTKSARMSNQENVVVLNDDAIIEKYIHKFIQLKDRAMRYT